MRTFLLPYKMSSNSCKVLANSMQVKRLRRTNSRYIPRSDDIIINWGCSEYAGFPVTYNHPTSVAMASDKAEFFLAMSMYEDVETVPFTESHSTASEWLEDGYSVVCRTMLSSHSGRGIVIASNTDDLVPSRLYTKYVKKNSEFRVHVVCGNVCVQKKLRDMAVPDPDWQVRTHTNGFIYSNIDRELPQEVLLMAKKCIHELGLDFGAVDIIHNEHYDKYYILEVNTAPGLQGSTLEWYTAQLNLTRRGHRYEN